MLSVRLVFSHLGVPAVRQSLSEKANSKSEVEVWGELRSVNTREPRTSVELRRSYYGVDIENDPTGVGWEPISKVSPGFCC